MNTNEAKRIRIEEYLHTLGYNLVRRQGDSLWYKSPFRDEQEPSFKVNMERNLWYDFGAGRGGNIIALARELYASDSLPYLLERIAEQAPSVRPVSFSFGGQPFSKPSFQQLEAVPLSSPRPIVLSAAEGDKYGTGKKRMQGGALSDWRQTLLCRWFSQPFGRLRDTQQAVQGLHSTEGHHPHTAGTAEGDLLPLRGLHGLPLLPHPAAGKMS